MNWEQIWTEIILSFVGIVFSALGVLVTCLINKYVKNQKLKDIINSLHQVVKDSVLEVYQTFVQELKEKDTFGPRSQKEALERCLVLINKNISDDVKTWLESNVSNVNDYLKSLIEAQIGLLKNTGGK